MKPITSGSGPIASTRRALVRPGQLGPGARGTRLTAPIGSNNDTIEIQGRAVKVGIQPKYIETLEQLIPIGRAGTADEAAGAVYLLCTPESNYISGQVVACSGGLAV